MPHEVRSNHTQYRMPAEWQPQAGIWASWPHNDQTWAHNLADAQAEFVALVKQIALHDPVFLLCGGETAKRQAMTAFGADHENIRLVDIPTNDAWARDYAPTFVKNIKTGQLAAIDWHYNAWGGKYPPFDLDQQVASRVARYLNIECVATDLCFEGGAIEINQSGILLSTRSCATDPNRNPDLSLHQIEQILINRLGAEAIIWLSGDAIEGDDTDGHIDQLARFTDDTTIVYAYGDQPDDPQLPGLQQNLADLKSGLSNAGCDHYRLLPLPIPEPIFFRDARTPASYCNFLITNHQVIVPQFGVKADGQALEILRPLFPDRKVIGLPSFHLSVGLGSFHCLTQQQPQ